MFTSKDDLKLGYGVDMEIGKFLIDRKVPLENLYWKTGYCISYLCRVIYLFPYTWIYNTGWGCLRLNCCQNSIFSWYRAHIA